MHLPSDIQTVLEKLNSAGFEAVAVGGAVRDALLGKTPDDWDVATSATPEQMHTVFAEYRMIDTGIQHGTVTVLIDHRPVEITTYRSEGEYRDHRHPDSVTFTDNLLDDLCRRDFTVNAMAYHPARELVDAFGGKEDLQRRVIRAVGDPDTRFSEDALRIFRGVRFAAVLDFAVEPATADAMCRTAPLLRNVAAERLLAELTKWIVSPSVYRTLIEHRAVFEQGIPAMDGLDVDAVELRVLPELPPRMPIRLAALVSTLPDAEKALAQLRLPKKTAVDVAAWCAAKDAPIPTTRVAVKRALSTHTPDWCRALWQWQAALRGEDASFALAALDAVMAAGDCVSRADLAVSGKDLMAWGVPRGDAVGDALERLLDAVLEDRCANTKDALYAYWNEHKKTDA